MAPQLFWRQIERELGAAKETARTLRNTVDSLGVQRKIFRAYEYPQNMENKVLAVENATLEVQKATVAAKSELQQKQEEVTKQKDLIERHTRRINDLKQDCCCCEARLAGMRTCGQQSHTRQSPPALHYALKSRAAQTFL